MAAAVSRKAFSLTCRASSSAGPHRRPSLATLQTRRNLSGKEPQLRLAPCYALVTPSTVPCHPDGRVQTSTAKHFMAAISCSLTGRLQGLKPLSSSYAWASCPATNKCLSSQWQPHKKPARPAPRIAPAPGSCPALAKTSRPSVAASLSACKNRPALPPPPLPQCTNC